jgi:hypothetical protein
MERVARPHTKNPNCGTPGWGEAYLPNTRRIKILGIRKIYSYGHAATSYDRREHKAGRFGICRMHAFWFQHVERRVAKVEQHRTEVRRKSGKVKKIEDLKVSRIHEAHSCRVPSGSFGSILMPFSRRQAPGMAALEPAVEIHAAHASVRHA